MKQENEKFCTECGTIINIKAEICPKCGVRQPYIPPPVDPVKTEQTNKFIACILLCWFLGVFGGHRFYVGRTGSAIAMLLTFGGCGIWAIIDLIVIISGNFKDANGNPIKNV